MNPGTENLSTASEGPGFAEAGTVAIVGLLLAGVLSVTALQVVVMQPKIFFPHFSCSFCALRLT